MRQQLILSCFRAYIKVNMIRRQRNRLGVSYAKQIAMRRFLWRLRRWGPRPPAANDDRFGLPTRTIIAQLRDTKRDLKRRS